MCHHYLIGRLATPPPDDVVEAPPAEDEVPPTPLLEERLS
jgi:hypothetical protein